MTFCCLRGRAVVSKVLPRSKREVLASISQIRFTSSLGRYLGFSLVQGRVRRADFGDLVERIRRKLGSWKGRLLNKAGRTTFAKAVLTSIPISCTQAMWFPQSACEEIDRIVRNFILARTDNTRGLNLVNWNAVTRCRHDGGLGIRQCSLANCFLITTKPSPYCYDRNMVLVFQYGI